MGTRQLINAKDSTILVSKGAVELAFAVRDRCNKSGWGILTYDCAYYEVVQTQQEAEEVIAATNWKKGKKKRGGKRNE